MASGDSFGAPRRQYSNRYIEYLSAWTTTRRLKKAVTGPSEGFVDPRAINGVHVARKGRGIRPTDNQEADFRVCARRHVANRSYACAEGLLDHSPRPLTAEPSLGRLQIDESRSKAVRRQSGRHNLSSMAGVGVIMTSEAPAHKPKRGAGSANPHTASSRSNMARVLAFSAVPDAEQQQQQAQQQDAVQQRQRMLWTEPSEAPSLCAEDSILRHCMSEADLALPVKFDASRAPAPNRMACGAEERRAVYLDSMRMYTTNKRHGEYGGPVKAARSNSGLRALAGLAC